MDWPVSPGNGGLVESQAQEWVVTTTNGLVTKIERLDRMTNQRTELSSEEYTAFAASYYASYYAGIRDYALAVASGNADIAQAYYQGMTQYFAVMGQP